MPFGAAVAAAYKNGLKYMELVSYLPPPIAFAYIDLNTIAGVRFYRFKMVSLSLIVIKGGF